MISISNSLFLNLKNILNVHFAARVILSLELAAQIVIVITEGISNSQYKKFPASDMMIGYTGQSLVVIIVAILQISLTSLILRNSGYILSRNTWKLSVAGVGVSCASICFRSFSSWFIQDPKSVYYIQTFNITSIFIVVGAVIWIPFAFCKSSKYVPERSNSSTRNNNHRSRITSTGIPFTYRPNHQEPTMDGDELPSYYEMISPPAYKRSLNRLQETDEASTSLPSTSSDGADVDMSRGLPFRSMEMMHHDCSRPATPQQQRDPSVPL